MLLKINVAGSAAASGTANAVTSKAPAQIDPNAKPGADWKQFDPTLQPAPGGTEHNHL